MYHRPLHRAVNDLNIDAVFKEPTTQSEFTEQIVQNITEVEPGHQCYKIASLPSSASAGTNATIQLAYWADYEGENNGKNETFYACADIVGHPPPQQIPAPSHLPKPTLS